MLFALAEGKRVTAEPSRNGDCPVCRESLIPKCGSIVSWHWAHRVNDCDPWHEPESEWHLAWKRRFPEASQEVVVGCHRADVRTPAGTVIELQHSAISPEEIAEREGFYGNMIWIFDASEFGRNLSLRQREGYISFRWRWPRKSLLAVRRPMFFDFGDKPLMVGCRFRPTEGQRLFHVKKIHDQVPCGGWGQFVPDERITAMR